jgi:hypothetical protein
MSGMSANCNAHAFFIPGFLPSSLPGSGQAAASFQPFFFFRWRIKRSIIYEVIDFTVTYSRS